jgi:hypothetical protein
LISSNFWPLYCLSFFDYGFWLPFWYLQTFDYYIVFHSLIMASDYPFDIFKLLTIILSFLLWLWLLITHLITSNFWPLYCLSFFYYVFWLPIWYLQTFDHYIVFTSSIMASDYPFDIFKHLTIILSFLLLLWLLNTPLISSNFWPLYCLSFFDYSFWLPLWYLQTFDHYIFFPSSIIASDYPFDIFKLLTIILSSLLLLWLLITPLISSNFWPLYCLSFFDYGFWLPLWYIQTFDHYIVFPSSIMASDYPLVSSNFSYMAIPPNIYKTWIPTDI